MKAVYVVFMILFAGVFLLSVMAIISYHKDAEENTKETEEIIREVIQRKQKGSGYEETAEQQIDFAKLKQINSDAVGWIVFYDPHINYPIVQTRDNSYYLNHSFKKNENTAGCLFMDCCNKSVDDKNVVIYGHNMLDRTMFGSLKDVFQEKFWSGKSSERDIIRITDTEQHLRQYKIFSYYITEAEDDYITTSFSDATAYTEFLKKITARSFRNLNVSVTAKDHILTLSTCAGAAGTSKRRVIHAKLIGKGS